MSDDWAAEQARRIGTEVKRLRADRSAQWVSERTEALGYRVPRAKIAELETGRRDFVTTAELVILAAALDTTPTALLYPPPYNDAAGDVDVIPGLQASRFWAAQWLAGNTPNPPIVEATGDPLLATAAYNANLEPLRARRRQDSITQYYAVQKMATDLKNAIDHLTSPGD